jgi:hypothetical protein
MKLPKLPWGAREPGSIEGWSNHGEDSTAEAMQAAARQLSPDEAALDRMFQASRQAFREARLERSIRETDRPRAPRRLRLAAALSVALLAVSATGVLAATESDPGEPFYRTRLAVEAFFLPAAGTPDRLTADLDRAQARLDEALTAWAAGNGNAEADALGAYADVVGSMAVPEDEALRAQMQERLALQRVLLQTLSADGGDGYPELERAMNRVGQLIEGSGQQPTPTPAPTGQGPDATPSHGPGSSGGGQQPSPSGQGPNPSGGPGDTGGDGQGSGSGGPGGPQGPKAS